MDVADEWTWEGSECSKPDVCSPTDILSVIVIQQVTKEAWPEDQHLHRLAIVNTHLEGGAVVIICSQQHPVHDACLSNWALVFLRSGVIS